MNYFAKGILTVSSLAAVLSLSVMAQAGQARQTKVNEPVVCDNRLPRVRGVKLAAPVANTVDFSGTHGDFEPVPLLLTEIFVGGRNPSCIIAHFSAEINTVDDLIVIQASIDDNPMEGHTLFPQELREPLPPLTPPIVFDRSSISPRGNNLPAMIAYSFFMIVKPGPHTVRIKWAGCCSTNPTSRSAEVLAAVLTLEYQGRLANYERDDD